MAIEILPEKVVAQIAAGEVVERPASVVKELLENSLDAGASDIRVDVLGGGRRLLRVSDNGFGMLSAEVELAFARHATSKLRTADDLLRITTLGFRGEALASIASVSHLTLTTRHRDEAAGTRLMLEGGTIVERQAIGAPVGTTLAVENLFYNVPARLKFLKKETTEKRQIATLITRYAMAYPDVRFTLLQDQVETFRSTGSGQLADVLVKSLGLSGFKEMLEVIGADEPREGHPAISVYGYASAPNFNRTDRSRIILFVNGRWIQDSALTYAVVQAYHTLLATGRYPSAVLMIQMPTDEVDVNVHPAKSEVRFRDPNAVFAAVQRAVRRAVIAAAQAPLLRGAHYTGSTLGSEPAGWTERGYLAAEQLDMGLELDSAGNYPRQQSYTLPQSSADEDPTAIPAGPGAPARPRTLPVLRVVGQVGAMYIVAEGPAGIYLIDQHAAHERIMYEQFMQAYEQGDTLAQRTLNAQTIELPPADAQFIEEHRDVLAAIGFELEPFGPNTFVIRAVPAMLANRDPVDIIAGVVQDLEAGNAPAQARIEARIIIRVCKRASVKAGQILSLDEMQGLIRQLERCQSPHTCPHGRPTMLHMSRDQLAREFGR